MRRCSAKCSACSVGLCPTSNIDPTLQLGCVDLLSKLPRYFTLRWDEYVLREGSKAIGYFVSWGNIEGRGIAARLTLRGAHVLACEMMKDGVMDVAIGSTSGHRISGASLAACCRGEALLTFNLQTIERTE
jgi:hypothetical protein